MLVQPHSISIELRIKTTAEHKDDACYALFQMLNKEYMISVDKPTCSRFIASSRNREIRLFLREVTGDGVLIVSQRIDVWSSRELNEFVGIVSKCLSTLHRFVEFSSVAYCTIRYIIRLPSNRFSRVPKYLDAIGIAVKSSDVKNLDESSIAVVDGVYIGRNLKAIEVRLVSLLRQGPIIDATLSFTCKVSLTNLHSELIEFVGVAEALIEMLKEVDQTRDPLLISLRKP